MLVMAPAFAQVAQRVAVPDAGQILAPPQAMPQTRPQMPAPQQNLDLPGTKAGPIRFTDIRVAGATVVEAGEIAALFAPLKNKDISAAALKDVLEKVDGLYRRAGYPLGRAYVPAQILRGGHLVVRVVEGYVANVVVQADSDETRDAVAGIAAHLTDERPLTSHTLQRYMLIVQGLPGITVGSKFQSMDPQTGATTLIISAAVKPATATLYMDNRANLDRLPFQPYLLGTFNNLLGRGDQISLSALLSPRQKDYAFYNLGYTQMVGTDGLRMGLSASWAQSLDSRTFSPFDVRAQTSRLGYIARYPLVMEPDKQLNLDGKIYFTHAGYTFAGIPIAHDNFLAAQIGGDYGRSISTNLAIGADLHLTQGLADMGPQPHTRGAAQAGFSKLQGEARLNYRPAADLTLNLRAIGQYGSGSLYASEEINFGGLQYGRGFGTAEISGDSGFGVSFQPEYTIPFSFADAGLGAAWSATPYMLVDYAKSFNTMGDRQADGELVSAGIGLRLAMSNLVTVTLEADKPLNRIPLFHGNQDPRFYFGLQFGLDRVTALIGETP
jgi:hemolysin activation/secretion protein